MSVDLDSTAASIDLYISLILRPTHLVYDDNNIQNQRTLSCFCVLLLMQTELKSRKHGVDLGTRLLLQIFSLPVGHCRCMVIILIIKIIGLSILVSVMVTVILMCLRESNRRSTEEAEKEEAELMEELGSSGEEM